MVLYGTLMNFNVRIDGQDRSQCDPTYMAKAREVAKQGGHHPRRHRHGRSPRHRAGVTDPKILDLFQVPDSMTRSAYANQVLREVAAKDPRARLVDLRGFVCPHGTCIDEVNGIKFRPDGVHPRGENAKYLARWLVPRVLAAAKERH